MDVDAQFKNKDILYMKTVLWPKHSLFNTKRIRFDGISAVTRIIAMRAIDDEHRIKLDLDHPLSSSIRCYLSHSVPA